MLRQLCLTQHQYRGTYSCSSPEISLMNRVKSGGVKKYYAVKEGRIKGIFETWPDCEQQVKGYKGSIFKSFTTREDAERFAGVSNYHAHGGANGGVNGGASGGAGGAASAAGSATGAGRNWQQGRNQSWGAGHSVAGAAPARGMSTAAGGRPSARSAVVAHSCAGDGAGSVEDQAWAARDAAMQQEQGTAHAAQPHGLNAAGAALGAPAVAAAPPTRCDNAPDIIAGAIKTGEAVELLPGIHQLEEGLYLLHFDGASRGNPGKAGAGAVLTHAGSGTEVAHLVHPLPYRSTNNEAEYCGLIMGLAAAVKLGIKQLHCKGDSKLVVNQVNGSWNVNKDHIQHYVDAAQRLIRTFLGPVVGRHLFDLKHVLREYNKVADRLSNVAVDMQ